MNKKKGTLAWSGALRGVLRAAGDGLAALQHRFRRGGNRRTRAARKDKVRATEATGAANAAPQHDRAREGAGALRVLLGWAAPVVVAVAAFVMPLLGVRAYEYVMTSGHFQVREVLVSGQRRLDAETLKRTLGVEAGTHLLVSDVEAMEERCVAHPWVSWCRVQKELPDRLVVELVEHEPAAYLAAGELWLVDAMGVVFAPATSGPDLSLALPILTGVDAARLADPAQRPGAEAELRGAINVLRLYDTMELSGRWPIGEVRLDAVRGLTLVLSPTGTEATVGFGPYREKLFRLEWVLESLRQDGKTAEYIVLDAFAAGDTVDGRVLVKADLPPATEAMMSQATERARRAERQVLGLPPNPDLFGPAVAPAQLEAGAGAVAPVAPEGEGLESAPLSGGRPALGPAQMGAGEGTGEGAEAGADGNADGNADGEAE